LRGSKGECDKKERAGRKGAREGGRQEEGREKTERQGKQ